MRLIDANALYEKTAEWETSALAYIEKLNRTPLWEMDEDEKAEWRRWTAILGERSAFKHDVADAPTIDPVKWIPVAERLPEEEVQVLVTDDAGGLATIDVDGGYFDEEYGRFEWFHSQNVTAWMPLPEPYAERREGNG